ncbi:MAG TPA: hypothetical protein VFQ74_06910 [Pseudolysinimonas sp.]|nr:hypothetical protein [Pseudolysinimonas sp.]
MTSTDPANQDAAAGAPASKRPSALLPVLAILLALVGGSLIGYSFLTGITAQLDPKLAHSSLYIALFFVGLGIVIVGIVFALVGIVRRAHRTTAMIALVLSMLPSFVVLVVAALLFL